MNADQNAVELNHAGFVARFGPRPRDFAGLIGGTLLAACASVWSLSHGPVILFVGPVAAIGCALAALPALTRRELHLTGEGLRLVVRRPWGVRQRSYALRALDVQPVSVDEMRFLDLKDERTGEHDWLPFGEDHAQWRWWLETLRELCEVARSRGEDKPREEELQARLQMYSLISGFGR